MVEFKNLELRVAETDEEKEECYRLRYEVFAQHRFIDPEKYPEKRIEDEYDPISTIFYAAKQRNGCQRFVGTIRITPPIVDRYQIEELFDIDFLKDKYGDGLWESSKIVIKDGIEDKFGTLIGLGALMFQFMEVNDIPAVVYMTGEWNERMYRKIGIYRCVPTVKIHPYNGQPTIALLWERERTTPLFKQLFSSLPVSVPMVDVEKKKQVLLQSKLRSEELLVVQSL